MPTAASTSSTGVSARPLRWGILGAARIFRGELGPAIRSLPDHVLQAIGGRRPDVVREVADELGIPARYDDYAGVLEDPDVAVIYIPLPNTEHLPWTLAALRAGKHVLCEKPLGMNADEVEQMIAASQESQRLLVEGFMWRYNPRVDLIRRLIIDEIGPLRLMRARYTFDLFASAQPGEIRLDPALGGGTLADVGCYCVQGLRTFADTPVVEVASWANSLDGAETRVSGELRFADGVIGQFYAAMDLPGDAVLELVGEHGIIRIPQAFRTRESLGDSVIHVETGDGETSERDVPFVDQYRLQIEAIGRAVLSGEAPVIPLAESLENALVLDAVRRSWRAGRVRLPERTS